MDKLAKGLKGRHLISLKDFSLEELQSFIDLGINLKARQSRGEIQHLLSGKTLGMIFAKNSTRTRVSFEVGIYQLGGCSLFLSSSDLQLGRGETIQDTSRVLSRYLDGIMIRTFEHQQVIDLAEASSIPVINGLTDLLHPCQVLADLMTLQEKRGRLEGLRLAYLGDGNNIAHSLIIGGAKMGLEVRIATPKGYEPRGEIVEEARRGACCGGKVFLTNDPREAVAGTDAVYTDVWTSMGQEAEAVERLEVFAPYQVNEELVAQADREVIVMHCLPAHRGQEITGGVLDGPHAVVWDQAENRLHVQKAVMALLMS